MVNTAPALPWLVTEPTIVCPGLMARCITAPATGARTMVSAASRSRSGALTMLAISVRLTPSMASLLRTAATAMAAELSPPRAVARSTRLCCQSFRAAPWPR